MVCGTHHMLYYPTWQILSGTWKICHASWICYTSLDQSRPVGSQDQLVGKSMGTIKYIHLQFADFIIPRTQNVCDHLWKFQITYPWGASDMRSDIHPEQFSGIWECTNENVTRDVCCVLQVMLVCTRWRYRYSVVEWHSRQISRLLDPKHEQQCSVWHRCWNKYFYKWNWDFKGKSTIFSVHQFIISHQQYKTFLPTACRWHHPLNMYQYWVLIIINYLFIHLCINVI